MLEARRRGRAGPVSVAAALLLALSALAGPALVRAESTPFTPSGAATAPGAPRTVTGATGAPAAAATPDTAGSWSAVLDWGLQAKHMVALPTGNVLVWSTGANASLWDPSTGSLSPTPAVFGDLHCAGQSMLADGRVIVVGGQDVSPHNGTSITSLFDPNTQTWTQGPDMAYLRWYATSTTLADGRVLATSGDAPDGSRATIPEVYDPATNTWTKLTGASRSQSLYPLMFVLPDGRVYEAGPGASTAILDPTGVGNWTPGPSNAYSTNGYSESAVMYAPGKILRAGGGDPAINRASVIDMTAANPAWRDVAPMAFPRRRMNLTILADGTVLAIGGTRAADDATQAVLEAEIWNPASEAWTTVAAMTEARMYHSSAVLLPDGRVVVGGGEAAGRLHSQIYSPPYLFRGPRPTISTAPATLTYGSSFRIDTPDAAAISSVALIRLNAATHAFDQNQRYVPLSFTAGAGFLTVTSPASGGVAPPGPYQLVIKTTTGVPSVARIVRIDTAASLQPGTIRGTITDAASGLPVSGVSVVNGPRSTTTNGLGTYVLNSVPSGDQVVRFSASGYADVTRTVSVVGGTSYQVDVAMAPPGAIAGHVTDATTGAALAGATITYPGGFTTTDATGAYSIPGIAAGSALIAASASAHVSAEKTATVVGGTTTTVDFSLALADTFLTGGVTDAATSDPIAGATVTAAGRTTTTDTIGRYRIDVAPGTWTIAVSAPGYDGQSHDAIVSTGTYAVTDFALTRTSQGASTLSFAPSADAYVSQTSPTKNYGGTTIRVRTGTTSSPSTYVSYLRFDVTGLAGRTVTGARLRLYATDGSADGGTVLPTGNGWGETTITWNSAPARGTPALGTIGKVVTNAWATIPLTPGGFAADGSYSFAIASASTDSAYYSSRSGTNPPVLELTVGGSSPPPPPPTGPTSSFSAAPLSGTAPVDVTVTDTSTGGPTTWSWDFGDGTTSTMAAPPAHRYAAAGSFTIRLTVSNSGGSSSATRTVTVSDGSAGSAVVAMTFEAGRLVDPATGASAVVGPVALETAAPLNGTASATVPASSTNAYLERGWSATDDGTIVATIRFGARPSAAVRILQVSDGGTTIGNLQLQPSGTLRLRNGSTTIGSESPPLVAGTTYRIAIHPRRGTGANALLEGYVVPLGTAFGAPFASSSTGTWTTAADRLRAGATAGGGVALTIDDIIVNAGGLPSGATLASAGATATLARAPVDPALDASRTRLSFVCPIEGIAAAS